MASIFILTDDAVLQILQHSETQDRTAFAYSCKRFRQTCLDARIFRKVDLSRRLLSKKQRGTIKEFFRDEEMSQHIRELNLSNLRVSNWQMDDDLEEFIVSNCFNLEALHVLNCGMSLQRLNRILQQAPKLTRLSWSLCDLTSEDKKFLHKSIESSDGICLKNIKHLHLESLNSLLHTKIMAYLLLSHCKYLEELEILFWQIPESYCTGVIFPSPADWFIPEFRAPSTSIEDTLQHLHSLTLVTLGGMFPFARRFLDYKAEFCDLIFSIMGKKSRETKWKKLWISPSISIRRLQDLFHLTKSSLPLDAVAAHANESCNAMDELKTFFQRINENTVRSLHLCQIKSWSNSIREICEPILRVGGHALKFLSLSHNPLCMIDAEDNVVLHTLFSNCLNITVLDLFYCCFEKDICEPLSKLKHLTKIQLAECAISSRYCSENQLEISKANLLTFVENCKNITDFEVCGCLDYHCELPCRFADGDLLAFAKLRNLKSLTLFNVSGISEWAFLQNISKHCKFLTMLRISANEHFNKSHSLILLESAKFLKHLAIDVPELDIGSECFWRLLSFATNLERLCITNNSAESVNVSGAVEMLKSLSRLHVFHVHCPQLENHHLFCDQIIRTLEESDHASNFEFLLQCWNLDVQRICCCKKLLPINITELCFMTPSLEMPML